MRLYLICIAFMLMLILSSGAVSPKVTPKPGLTATPANATLLATAAAAPTWTPLGGCPRTVIPPEWQSQRADPRWEPFAPGLEWRTTIDTVYYVKYPTKVYIRAAVPQPEPAAVIGTRFGSSPPEQMHTSLDPIQAIDPQTGANLYGDPPGMIRVLGALNFPSKGCWDLDIRVHDLEGHVIVLVQGL